MASCIKCNKEVGCSCSLKDGVCKECRRAAQNEPAPKINVTVNIPKS
jgi:hypothetical protein